MSDTTDHTDPAVLALREREAELNAEIEHLDIARVVLVARKKEIGTAIDLVLGNGRKKPGRKPGTARAVGKPDEPPRVMPGTESYRNQAMPLAGELHASNMSLSEALRGSLVMTQPPDDAA